MLGSIPTVSLQELLHVPGVVQIHDVVLSLVYFSHFFFPLAFAFALWVTNRKGYYRFATTLMVVSFGAFLTFLAVPVAPPRFAGQYGEALPVVDVVADVAAAISWQGFGWLYAHMVGESSRCVSVPALGLPAHRPALPAGVAPPAGDRVDSVRPTGIVRHRLSRTSLRDRSGRRRPVCIAGHLLTRRLFPAA